MSRRLVAVVNNGVTGDSRVLRMAGAARDRGWQVLVVGRSPDRREHRLVEGGLDVVLVPVEPRLARGGTVRRLAADVVPPARPAAVRTARQWLAARDRVAHHRPGLLRHGAWRLMDPWVQDLELAMADAVEEFAPDLIHAHDRHTIALAARSAATLRARGRRVRWVLDAHEYVAATAARGGTGVRGRARRAMVVGQQAEFIDDADAVVTVSEELAEMLVSDHHLRRDPVVVLNAPLPRQAGTPASPGLREVAAIPDDVPLLVYAGGCAPQRGVSTAVEALELLPQARLAVVASPDDRDVPVLLELARERGVSERVHRVDYVPPEQVVDLLRGADVGLVPLLHRPNHEISLVTKFLEYLHAGLPVVVSDVRTMARFTSEHGTGEVFPAGDAVGLAHAVTRVLDDRERYAYAVRTCPAVEETSWPRQAARLMDLYDDLVPPAGGSGARGLPYPAGR